MAFAPAVLFTVTCTLEASIDTMVSDLAAAFAAHGAHARVALYTTSAPNRELISGLLADLRSYDGPRFLVDVNGKSRFFSGGEGAAAPVSLLDEWAIPRYSLFESNPLAHLEHLAAAPKMTAWSVVDHSHRDTLLGLGMAPERVAFVPHAGPLPSAEVDPTADRPIDVLFVGNIGAHPPLDAWLAELGLAGGMARAATEALEQVLANEADSFPAILEAIGRQGLAPELRREARIALAIEARINSMRRLEALTSIRSTPVLACGTIASSIRLPDNVTVRGPVTFATSLALMAQAKLVTNFMPFRTGGHERVFYGLSRGACCLSDPSSLLADGMGAEGGVIERAAPRLLDEQVATLVGDGRALDRRRAAGRAWYAAAHTWSHRVPIILAMMRDCFFG
ncbi:MAG: hypothetical protein ACM33T_16455 [Solirubrobacterales bacterium]